MVAHGTRTGESLCGVARLFFNGQTRAVYTDEVIFAVYVWAVVHDRPVLWACDPSNWPPDLIRRPLPTQSTMSRRLRRATFEHLLYDIENALLSLTLIHAQWLRVIDAKPLPVGGPSKDADATWGRGAGGIQKGYKLHVIWGDGPLPITWALAGLNVSERRIAMALVQDLPGEGYLLFWEGVSTNDRSSERVQYRSEHISRPFRAWTTTVTSNPGLRPGLP